LELEEQVSATLRIEVTDSVFATLALAVLPLADPVVELPIFELPLVEFPLACPALAEPEAPESGLPLAVAVALEPMVPVTSTCLLTFPLSWESSP